MTAPIELVVEGGSAGQATQYPHLLAPLDVAGLRLPNRAVMGAMHTRLETLDRAEQRLTAFFRARALGEVGLIITGGVAPNLEGRIEDDAPVLAPDSDFTMHRAIVDAVADTPTKICMQILHAGRYAKFAGCVGPSTRKAPINRFAPRALTTAEVWRTIQDFGRTAAFARDLGYHGIEIMGSEGYLINEFTAPATNDRSDEFGGDFIGRTRLPLEILRSVRRSAGKDFLVIYRISAVDLVEGGMTGDETVALAKLLAQEGADILNTGVGWHESRVPTIAHVVPRAGWSFAVEPIKRAVDIPVIASNRINDPQVAEDLIARGAADLVSMARPLLADPDFMRKTRLGEPQSINTCIACNQACLDRIFERQAASCLVNPRAAREIEFGRARPEHTKRMAVIGGGPAGMSFALHAAERGHSVTLFEAAAVLGGQLQMARVIPLKTEFDEMLRYFLRRLDALRVEVRLSTRPKPQELASQPFDAFVVATGVRPRPLDIPGIEHPSVLTYVDVLLHKKAVGRRAAIIGAGGIGFDIAEYLLGEPHSAPDLREFAHEYGIDTSLSRAGGLLRQTDMVAKRAITLLQRSSGRIGSKLATSTGWMRRSKLARLGVQMIGGVLYERIDDEGLHVVIDGSPHVVEADNIIICAGQDSEREIYSELRVCVPDKPVQIIGGARVSAEVDAMRAIDEAVRLAEAM